MLFTIIKHAHSGLRWLVLIALVFAIANALSKLLNKADYKSSDKKINILILSLLHTQLLLGLILYFISPFVQFSVESMSNPLLRFYLLEHLSMMFIAAALITVGYIRTKKISKSYIKHRAILIFFSISLLIIFLAIPWPWLDLGGSWF